MTPEQTYDAIKEALRGVARGNLSTTAAWRAMYADTRKRLAAIGITLTDTQLHRIHWNDQIRTLWDQVEYVMERHYAKRGERVIWPARRGEVVRTERKK